MTEAEVRAWLLGYAWLGSKERNEREVECIMSQGDWKYIDARADQYAGAQNEPGPKTFSEGIEYALSALYEGHDGPHIKTCPNWKPLELKAGETVRYQDEMIDDIVVIDEVLDDGMYSVRYQGENETFILSGSHLSHR